MTFYFRFKKCHFSKDFIKNFEFDVKSPFFCFLVNSAVKLIFWGGGRHKIWVLFDGTGGTDGILKVSFNFLDTLLVYRLCICLLEYEDIFLFSWWVMGHILVL